MDIWQGADPEGSVQRRLDGPLLRHADRPAGPSADRRRGRGALPKAFTQTRRPLPAIENAQTFGLQPAYEAKDTGRRTASLLKLYDVYKPANTPYAALLDTTLDSAEQASAQLKAASATTSRPCSTRRSRSPPACVCWPS